MNTDFGNQKIKVKNYFTDSYSQIAAFCSYAFM